MSIQRYSSVRLVHLTENEYGPVVKFEDHQAEIAELTKRLEAAEQELHAWRTYGCTSCDGSGTFHSVDGEYRGECKACNAAALRTAELNAARYEWLRNSEQDVGLVIDKMVSSGIYEYRAGVELDAAIDAARLAQGESNGD